MLDLLQPQNLGLSLTINQNNMYIEIFKSDFNRSKAFPCRPQIQYYVSYALRTISWLMRCYYSHCPNGVKYVPKIFHWS